MISETFSQFRKDIIENLSFSRVLFWFVFLPLILILLSLAYEDLTSSFFLSKLERKAALLKQLHELERDGIRQSHSLDAIYSRTTAELNSYQVERPAVFSVLTHKLTIAMAAGMPLGLLIALAVVFTSSKKERPGSKIALVFGIANRARRRGNCPCNNRILQPFDRCRCNSRNSDSVHRICRGASV